MTSYSNFQNQNSSEKITLVSMNASKRLQGWELHSGSIYKLTDFKFKVISTIEDSGIPYSEVADIGSVTTSKYFLDQDNEILYLRTSDSTNPNGKFLVAILNLFFSTAPITLPFDLDSGFEVFWEPLIKSTSEYGVSIDTINQTSEAIEGSGTLTLFNDFDFWPKNFDKLSFENQKVIVYSFNRNLDVNEAKVIFYGTIDKKSYSNDSISFQLKDQFANLRAEIPLDNIGSLDERTGEDLEEAKQRLILGRVFGLVPTNIDQVLDGYPLTGTVTIAFQDDTLFGSGTQFLKEVSPNDRIILADKEFTVGQVIDDDELVLTSLYDGAVGIDSDAVLYKPDKSKRHINRFYKLAGHTLREPQTTTLSGSTISILFVDSTRDIYADDTIYIGDLGSGEVAFVEKVIGENYILLKSSLATTPAAGVAVRRPAIQNLRLDSTLLQYYRDYLFDAETAELQLRETAESNVSQILNLGSNVTFTNGLRTVSGTGFQGIIEPGFMIGVEGNSSFFEVLSVDSDILLTLRTAANFSSTATGRYKNLIFNPREMSITCDLLGKTDDDTTDGNLLKTAPAISKYLLTNAGLEDFIDTDSFDDAEEIVYQHLGISIPENFDDTTSPTYRDILNKVNKSVLGSLIQNEAYQFSYQLLHPVKDMNAVRFDEADILSFTLNATAENVVKTAIVEYRPKELDYVTNNAVVATKEATSDKANYLIKTDRTKTISTLLVEQDDAQTAANRWSFLLEASTGRLSFTTKLKGMTLEVGNIIEINHRKFFERFGGSSKRKLVLVEGVLRTGSTVKVDATDLSNSFNRIAAINNFTSDASSASEDEMIYGGYITDQYGLTNNDPNSADTNVIW